MAALEIEYVITLTPGITIDYIQINSKKILGRELKKPVENVIRSTQSIHIDIGYNKSFTFFFVGSSKYLESNVKIDFLCNGESILNDCIVLKPRSNGFITLSWHTIELPSLLVDRILDKEFSIFDPGNPLNINIEDVIKEFKKSSSLPSKSDDIFKNKSTQDHSIDESNSNQNQLPPIQHKTNDKHIFKDENGKSEPNPRPSHYKPPTNSGGGQGKDPFELFKKTSEKTVANNIKQSDEKITNDPGGVVSVFYATTRNKTGSSIPNQYFGNEIGPISYGICNINIPPKHIIGEIERPTKILLWQRKENVLKDIVLKKIIDINKNDFFSWLNVSINMASKDSGLIFIHGFNNTFEEAAWRTGQLAYDLPFEGAIGFFSWPSTGNKLDYLRDIERADASVSSFTQFVEDFVKNVEIKELHFVAHSMGNRLLTRALLKLTKTESFTSKIDVISQIILAAPDIDQELFINDILPEFKKLGKRRTIYASDKDKALKLSQILRTGLPRIGEAGENILVADGIDTIDASNVMSEGNHHSYMFETKELLTDIYLLINEGWEPSKRMLRQVTKPPSNYWLFRK